jgi:multidrug resistance protein, MATE family
LSTCIARLYMAATLAGFIWWFERDSQAGLKSLFRLPDTRRIRLLLHIGLPAATQIFLEIGAFGAAAMLAGRLEPAALASHQIAINCAALAYMVPLGLSSAAAVAVGQSIGRRLYALARREGFIAIAFSCIFMSCSAALFVMAPRQLLDVYTKDAEVLRIGRWLLAIAAVFQLFDGIQTVATGALRGLGNTHTPMLVNLAGYWLFGLPFGAALCFGYGMGVYGLWIGLSLALILIALCLLYAWNRNSKRMVPVLAGN